MIDTVILYSLLTTSIYYLLSRAVITRFLWSRYPDWLAQFADCSACSSYWYGVGLALTIGRTYDLSYLDLEGKNWLTPVVVGLCSMVLTPIIAGLMQHGLDQVGQIVLPDPESDSKDPS